MSRVTISEVRDAFGFLYESIHDRDFRKSLRLHEWNEKRLLPLVRTLLLSYFRHCSSEVEVRLSSSASGWGRIDFQIDDVAVEFAGRKPMDRKGPISSKVNRSEMIKLMTYDGPELLVLFDFSKHHFEEADLERFRSYPSLGRGRFHGSAFNVAYFLSRAGKAQTVSGDESQHQGNEAHLIATADRNGFVRQWGKADGEGR